MEADQEARHLLGETLLTSLCCGHEGHNPKAPFGGHIKKGKKHLT